MGQKSIKPGLYKPAPFVHHHGQVWAHARIPESERLGVCFLCRQESVLILSHIVSKAFINQGQIGAIGNAYSGLIETRSAQDGQKFYMLCQSCETNVSQWERQLAIFIKNVYRLKLPYDFSAQEKHSISLAIAGMCARQYYAERNFLNAARRPQWDIELLSSVEKLLVSNDSSSFSIAAFRLAKPQELEKESNLFAFYPRLQKDTVRHMHVIGSFAFGEMLWMIARDPNTLGDRIRTEVSISAAISFLKGRTTLASVRVR